MSFALGFWACVVLGLNIINIYDDDEAIMVGKICILTLTILTSIKIGASL